MTIDTNEVLGKLLANWKTSVNGLLGLAIACLIAYTALPAGVKWPVVALALLRAAVGVLQKDAGVVLAQTPAGEVKAVEGTEIPADGTLPVVGK